MKFRLQVSVAIAFAVLTVIVLSIAVALFYTGNKKLAIETARTAMNEARTKTDAALVAMVSPVGRTVDTMAAFLRAFPKDAASLGSLAVVDRQIDGLDQIYSAYFAFETDGAFYQVRNAAGGGAPEGAVKTYRTIEAAGAGRLEHHLYLSRTGEVLSESRSPGTFDPRQRPWYQLAREHDGLVVSPVYIFESTGRPGLTFSKRVLADDGSLIGVVGADMSLDTITSELNAFRIGEAGEVFILNKEGQLIAWSDSAGGQEGNPVADAGIEGWKRTGETFFTFTRPGAKGPYLASVTGLSPVMGIEPIVGVIVPQRQFTGTIIATTQRVVAISLLIMIVAIAATVLLARLLSAPLRTVADEARRISDFDLSGEFELFSRISEVNDLGEAVSNMRNSLRSFVAYVPRDLVRSIVSSGQSVRVGGTSRELTILFTDIEGFTRKSENLSPEIVMSDLSRYFEEMDTAIFGNGGTIDKYIGDAVMAIWNAPAEDPDHVVRACRATLACREAEAGLNARVGKSNLFPTRTRFGLHTDKVLVGNVGSARRLQYTAIGGAVNLASRIEALNKVYGTDILVTQNVVDRAGPGFVFRPVDTVSPAGTTHPIALFELVCEAPPREALPPLDSAGAEKVAGEIADWSAFYDLYRSRDWPAALAALEALAPHSTRETLVNLYIDRCREFIRKPPPENWDGVHTYDKK